MITYCGLVLVGTKKKKKRIQHLIVLYKKALDVFKTPWFLKVKTGTFKFYSSWIPNSLKLWVLRILPHQYTPNLTRPKVSASQPGDRVASPSTPPPAPV